MSGDDVRALALALPEAEEIETWGHPTFRVRGKMFAAMDAEGTSGSVKASLEAQTALLASEPDTFFRPKYVGQHGWVGVRFASVDPDELGELLEDGWRMTAPKRVVRVFDEGH
jgi:hypothetical protein